MCKDLSLASVTNHDKAFISRFAVHMAFIIYTCRYNCFVKTGATQILVYFICTYNTFGYAVTVTVSTNWSSTSVKETLWVLNPCIFIKGGWS